MPQMLLDLLLSSTPQHTQQVPLPLALISRLGVVCIVLRSSANHPTALLTFDHSSTPSVLQPCLKQLSKDTSNSTSSSQNSPSFLQLPSLSLQSPTTSHLLRRGLCEMSNYSTCSHSPAHKSQSNSHTTLSSTHYMRASSRTSLSRTRV